MLNNGRETMRKLSRLVSNAVLVVMLLAVALVPFLTAPQPVQAADLVSYPVLKDGVQHYKTQFPAGLRYPNGWYGTFSFAPPASEIILFDDDWSKDWGICIFSMPIGSVPTGDTGSAY
jgi:hypothetical protein